jgi:hypothetical protein
VCNKDVKIRILKKFHNLTKLCSSIYASTALFWILAAFAMYSSFYTADRSLCIGDQPVGRPLPTYRTTQTQNKFTQTIPQVGFEPNIPVFERENTGHDLDRPVTLIGYNVIYTLVIKLKG